MPGAFRPFSFSLLSLLERADNELCVILLGARKTKTILDFTKSKHHSTLYLDSDVNSLFLHLLLIPSWQIRIVILSFLHVSHLDNYQEKVAFLNRYFLLENLF